MEGWTHSFSSPFMLHGRRLPSRSVVQCVNTRSSEVWRGLRWCSGGVEWWRHWSSPWRVGHSLSEWVGEGVTFTDEWLESLRLGSLVSIPRRVWRERTKKIVISTYNTLLGSLLSSSGDHEAWEGGRKRREKGKKRRGGEKRGRKMQLKGYPPLGCRPPQERAQGAHARPSTPRDLAPAQARRSRGEAEAPPRLDRQSQIAISDADTKWKSTLLAIYSPKLEAIARFLIEIFAFEINWVLARNGSKFTLTRWLGERMGVFRDMCWEVGKGLEGCVIILRDGCIIFSYHLMHSITTFDHGESKE